MRLNGLKNGRRFSPAGKFAFVSFDSRSDGLWEMAVGIEPFTAELAKVCQCNPVVMETSIDVTLLDNLPLFITQSLSGVRMNELLILLLFTLKFGLGEQWSFMLL